MTDPDASRSLDPAVGVRRREGAISVGPVQGGWRLEAAICAVAGRFRYSPAARAPEGVDTAFDPQAWTPP